MRAIARTRECLEHVEGHPQGAGDVCWRLPGLRIYDSEHEATVWLGVGDQSYLWR